ncbi:MAG TPA: Holliday junction resolvase RuvX [Candidatus Paceibacterota bacterium]
MRYLGIDFGTQNIGLALTDEEGRMAFPLRTLPARRDLVTDIVATIEKERVGAIVIGESRNFKGEENLIMKKVHEFRTLLKAHVSLPIYFESETLTSKEAERIQGHGKTIDASAATLILQSFLDRQKNISMNEETKNITQELNKISIDDFKSVEMIVGEIQQAERVPDTDKLLRLTVDLGEAEPRQVISGIATFFPDVSILHGKKCVFVGNMEPRTIRGLVSNGMILAAHTDDGAFALMVPDGDVKTGTRVG